MISALFIELTIATAPFFLCLEISFPAYTFTADRGKATTFFRPLVNDNQINNIDIVKTLTSEALVYAYNQYASKDFSTILGFYAIPTVLVQHDVDWTIYKANNPRRIEQSLNHNVDFVKSFQ